MKYKTQKLVERFTGLISQWPGVECITLNEAAQADILDPYFALILDVFISAPIPDALNRCYAYGNDVAAFESSGQNEKDRFLIGDIPVRLEYKDIKNVKELVSIVDTNINSLWLIKDSGTYSFYRLAHGDVIFSRGTWIHDIRKQLEKTSEMFWLETRGSAQSKMEHFLSDLGASSFQGDEFHYLLASAGFIKMACLTLFCVNRRFEPSHRAYYRQVLELPVLPKAFAAQLENFLDTETDASMERRFKLATLIARGIVAL